MNTYPKYLSDRPIGKDRFDSGSQELLAKAIASHIVQNDTENSLPRIIGIDGTWGSGKSNVVKLVQNLLKENKIKYHFFEYDAWGNQEDLQRRSLLEQLTDNLITTEILTGSTSVKIKGGKSKKVSWDEKLKLLLARKTETSIESYPRLSSGIIASALTIIGTSITSFFSTILYEQWGQICSIIVAFLPILIALLVWLIAILFNRKYASLSYLLAIYQDKVTNETEYEVISEDEPSVVEFRSWMEDVSISLNTNICDKLVIVFDNMDRLPSEKVKQLWSSIHTFFAEKGFENIWVIIPFDEEHLACAFGENGDKQLELTRYFINKTFPITFSVPKPIITDYKNIFRELYIEAFGKELATDEELVNRIYRLTHTNPNIRDIIIFINKMVSFYQIWGVQLKIRNIAIYLLFKDEIQKEPVKAILAGDYLGVISNIIDVDEDFKSEIAALTYGVKKEIAKEIPLTEYINNCIEGKPNYDINLYSEIDGSFDLILREVFDNTDVAKNALLVKCLYCLKQSNAERQKIWNDLGRRLLKDNIKELSLPDEFKIAVEKTSKEICKQLVDRICSIWRSVRDFNGASYVKNINLLETIAKDKCVIPKSEIKVTASAFVDAIKLAKNNYKRYNLIANPDDVDEYLSQKLTNDFVYSDVVEILYSEKFCTFGKLKTRIEEFVSEDNIESQNIWHICLSYRILNKTKVNKLIDANQLSRLISELEQQETTELEDGYIDLLAMSLASNNDVEIDEKYIPQIAMIIDSYADYGNLLVKNLSWNNDSLDRLLKYMIENNCGIDIDLEQVLRNFYNIINKYNITGETFLKNLEKWTSQFTQIKDEYNEDNISLLLPKEIYTYTTIVNNNLAKAINQFAIDALGNRTKDEFITTEKNYSSDYWHRTLNEFCLNKAFDNNVPVSVEEYAKHIYLDIAKGANKINNEYFCRIVNNISALNKSGIFTEIRDLYCNHHATINEAIFVLFEERLRIYGELLQRKKEVVDTILKPIIKYKAVKDIIINNSEFYKNLFNGITLDNAFKKIISDYWNDETGLHHILGITLNENEK